ncbi:MAG: biotin--[acetyl-CoA-carboxylase] ligase [Gammaproteobacteria bacterium]
MPDRLQVLSTLADGRFHSGADLAAALGVTRTAVWKHVRHLADYGLAVEAIRGRGYRLPMPIELLDAGAIRAAIDPARQPRLTALDLHFETDSTNTRLLEAARGGDITGRACLAEFQRSGRGRRGRRWEAPLGTGICLSIGWRFQRPAAALTALGLAIGIGCARAMTRLGVQDIGLKWPNDVMHDGHKLAGILIEMSGESDGPCTVVVGVGANVSFPRHLAGDFRQPWTDIAGAAGRYVSRNGAAAALIGELIGVMEAFDSDGFATLEDEWSRLDVLRDRAVDIQQPHATVTGVARGVAADGSLVVEIDGRRERFFSGDVSVRLTP